MAYLFGSGNTDHIDCGTPARASTFTVWARFKLAAADTASKTVMTFRTATLVQAQVLFTGGTNVVNASVTSSGTPTAATWTSGFTGGSIHTLAMTYDASFIAIFADTDATAKATQAQGNPVDQDASMLFQIGNVAAAPTLSLAGTMYELGWWAGTVLTGAQLAAMGSGTPPATDPSNYWPLVSDAVALFGGINGTVTGASVVAHSGTNLYGAVAPTRFHGALGSGFGGRQVVIA